MPPENKVLSNIVVTIEKDTLDVLSIAKDNAYSSSKIFHSHIKTAKKTLFFDCLRYIFQGALDEEFRTIILLLAIRSFNMPLEFKGALTSIAFLSMAFTPITQQWASRSRWNSMQISAFYFTLMGIAFFCAAFVTSWIPFFILLAFIKICDKQQIPLMIEIYTHNYPKTNRGFRVGIALAFMPIGGIIFSSIATHFLNTNLSNFAPLLFLAGFLALGCALCFLNIPAKKAPLKECLSLWNHSKLIVQDHLFTGILLLHSLIAVAHQMTLPLRMEYLANQKSLAISGATIIAIFGVIQPLATILSGPIWGKLYDHVSLITMRQCVTFCFLIGIPLFFVTNNLGIIYLASVLLGIGRGGGAIFWSLWISEIAPPHKITEYMATNSVIMGLRDALAPVLGYFLIVHIGPIAVGIVAFLLLVFSLLGFECINNHPAYIKRISAESCE